jgi:hypothetical protein
MAHEQVLDVSRYTNLDRETRDDSEDSIRFEVLDMLAEAAKLTLYAGSARILSFHRWTGCAYRSDDTRQD